MMAPLYFGIPLRARSTTNDWGLVCTNLQRTLESVLGQTDAEVAVIIAGHDKPEFLTTYDPRVTFIDISDTAPPPEGVDQFNEDKKHKKIRIGHALRQTINRPVYYMHMDADDLVHTRFAHRVLKDKNKSGYLIHRGYVVDVANGEIAKADEKTTPFYKHCGSCAVVHFAPDELPHKPTGGTSPFSQYLHHGKYVETAAAQGKILQPMSSYAGAYLVNHGENNRRYKGLDSKKVDFVSRNRITDPDLIKDICGGFHGLAEIMENKAS